MPKLYFDSNRVADLPLHNGKVPEWLAVRMAELGGKIVEAIVLEYGRKQFLERLSNPQWFQAFGAVLGMDWHSSGITTSVMGALKRSVNYRSNELGIYIAGGKGKHSRQTPAELLRIGDRTGLPADEFVRTSRLTAKIDNNAIQDGFQIYLHSFVLTREGDWAVVQQGINGLEGMARRYHWNSEHLKSYTESPHTFVYGRNQGEILNLTDPEATESKTAMLQILTEKPESIIQEAQRLILPNHHDVKAKDVNLKRLGAMLAVTRKMPVTNFESLLLLENVGPRALQSLALVSEIIHGTPSRFSDPARFSFAHGGKDGYPFPVPTKTYDETISEMQTVIDKSKLGYKDKSEALKNLFLVARNAEKDFTPDETLFDNVIRREKEDSWKYGGRTVLGKSKPPNGQLGLFD